MLIRIITRDASYGIEASDIPELNLLGDRKTMASQAGRD